MCVVTGAQQPVGQAIIKELAGECHQVQIDILHNGLGSIDRRVRPRNVQELC